MRRAVLWLTGLVPVLAATACGTVVTAGGAAPLPPGVMSAAQACRHYVRGVRGVEQVHLVLTTYAKGEPAESSGDIATGMPPNTLVWVLDVHAKPADVERAYLAMSVPPNWKPPRRRPDQYSVVMNARTGSESDWGVGPGWPEPLWKAGTVISLPPQC